MFIQIQNYQAKDSEILTRIFEKSILVIDDKFYMSHQKAWLGNHSRDFRQARFDKSLPIITLYPGKNSGFF